MLFYVSTFRQKDMICTVHKTSFPLIESEKLFEKSLIGKLSWNRHFFLMSIEYMQCCQLYFFSTFFFWFIDFFFLEKNLEFFMRMNTLHFAFTRNPKTTMNGGKVGKWIQLCFCNFGKTSFIWINCYFHGNFFAIKFKHARSNLLLWMKVHM